jgi:hypothetical protein
MLHEGLNELVVVFGNFHECVLIDERVGGVGLLVLVAKEVVTVIVAIVEQVFAIITVAVLIVAKDIIVVGISVGAIAEVVVVVVVVEHVVIG